MGIRTRPNPPDRYQLGAGTVHVWAADLDEPAPKAGLLSEQERARVERFARERDQRRWGRAHEVLRSLLGGYSKTDPRALRFAIGAHGKPELEGRGGVCFNLAHSGNVAIYAIAVQPVGVDVELGNRDTHVLAVAERAFGSAAAARLSALDPRARRREFLREWVRHEARLKCLGTGLGGTDTDAQGRQPWVAHLDLPPRWANAGAMAAVATMAEPEEVCCWEWKE